MTEWHGMSERFKPVLEREKYVKAYALRSEGLTLREIGERLGVSAMRAFTLVKKYRAALIGQKSKRH